MQTLPNTESPTTVADDEFDCREERGKELAATAQLKRLGDKWVVPSATTASTTYLVDLAAEEGATCTCPDFELRRRKCKHVHCVEWTIIREVSDDGTVTETRSMKVTYRQDWPAYNAAQMEEKDRVAMLLRALCDGIVNQPHPGRGRKPTPTSDAVYGMTMKVYTTFSGRRATTDLRSCADAGHMTKAPHYNSLFDCFGDEKLTPILKALIADSAAPLAAVESQFAVDSTGFGTSVFRRWFDHKYGRERKEHRWLKAHASVGVHTNIVTAINVTDESGGDCPELPALINATHLRFDIAEVSADKAYLSRANLAAIEKVGAVPYIPFKSNSQGTGPAAWRRMWGLFMYRSDEFQVHYHKRSNVESTFSAIKRLLGGALRSKTFTAQVNEVLCKVLAYNLTVLVHAIHELGIDPVFGGPSKEIN